MTSGCSGLPKLRQFTTASAVAPAHGHVGHRPRPPSAPCRRAGRASTSGGSSRSRAPCPCSRPAARARRGAAAPRRRPGPTTVFKKSWSRTGDRPGPGRSAGPRGRRPRRAGGSASVGSFAREPRPVGGLGAGPVVEGGVVGQRRRRAPRRGSRRRSRRGSAASRWARRPRRRSGSVTRPTTVAAHLPARAELPRPWASDSGVTMASMRSWLSETMTSQGSMPGSRRGTAVTSTSMPTPPRAAVSRGRADEPGAAEVLDADDEALVEQRQAGLDEALLLVGVADLDARALRVVEAGRAVLALEAGRGQHRDAADAVAARRRAEQHREVARPRRDARARGARRAARPRRAR